MCCGEWRAIRAGDGRNWTGTWLERSSYLFWAENESKNSKSLNRFFSDERVLCSSRLSAVIVFLHSSFFSFPIVAGRNRSPSLKRSTIIGLVGDGRAGRPESCRADEEVKRRIMTSGNDGPWFGAIIAAVGLGDWQRYRWLLFCARRWGDRPRTMEPVTFHRIVPPLHWWWPAV